MRAFVGWILALGLAVSPVMAKAGGAAGEDNPATTKTDTPAAANLESELDELRDVLQSQAKQIQEQSELLKQQQEKMDALAKELKTSSAASEKVVAAPETTTMASAVAVASPSSIPTASSAAPAAIAAAPQDEEKPSPLYFSIGGAHFTPGGFMDLTNVFRSKDLGSGIGTSFNGITYNNSLPAGQLTEDRFSAQNSRITLRMDSKVAGGDTVGYLEADFLGVTNDNLNVTSNSNTLRMRLYFVDYRRPKWEILAGQDWSMLTPNRNGIGFMPGDIFFSQDMDTNYQVGLVWERTPQFRFILHPSKTVAFGISIENPQQFTGSAVTFPAGFPGLTGNNPQVDQNVNINNPSGTSNPLAVPNLHPDVVAKLTFDPKFGSHSAHFEVAGVYSTYKVNSDTTTGPVTSVGNSTLKAGGGSVNSNFEIFKNFRIIETTYWSSGGGREIGSSNVPDFIVRPVNSSGIFTLSPVHSGAGIGGFEWQTTPKLMLYGYYGGVYVDRNTEASGAAPCTSAATCVGYGFAGGSNSQNRTIQEGTIGWVQYFWRNPNYGALSMITQASYLSRNPWSPTSTGTGLPKDAHLGMAYIDLRYTLP